MLLPFTCTVHSTHTHTSTQLVADTPHTYDRNLFHKYPCKIYYQCTATAVRVKGLFSDISMHWTYNEFMQFKLSHSVSAVTARLHLYTLGSFQHKKRRKTQTLDAPNIFSL